MLRRARLAALALLSLLCGAAPAVAQDMDQGQARISARSDVTMGIENGPGTSGTRLQAMMRAVSAELGKIRECYAEVTSERPTVQGQMEIDLELPQRGRVRVRVDEDSTDDRLLSRCVKRALLRATYREVDRPARVKVKLTFGNTAAAGVEETRRRTEEQAAAAVERADDGKLLARGGTADGQVRFTVIGEQRASEGQVQAVHSAVQAAVPGLLDCRRRAGRRDMDPAGDIMLQLAVPRRGRPQARTLDNGVEDRRAPLCVTRILQRADWSSEAAGRIKVKIRFAPREALDVPARNQ